MAKPILLFQRVIPSYRKAIFEKLYDQLNIITCFSAEARPSGLSTEETQAKWNLKIGKLKLGSRRTNVIQNFISPMKLHRPKILITEFSLGYLTFWFLWLFKPIFRYKLILWTHGVNNKEIFAPFTKPSRKLALWFMKNADAVIFYSRKRRDAVAQKAKREEGYFVAFNTIDTDTLNEIFVKLKDKGKHVIKTELGFTSKYNIIYVGQLKEDKRLDILLYAFQLLSTDLDIQLHIIGSGAEEKRIREAMLLNKKINYYGAIFDDSIVGKYLLASDLMVMSGYLGLSVVHSFAFGLPIISCRSTQTGPFHSPEAEYIVDGENGIFCDFNANAVAESIRSTLLNNNALENMAENALFTAYNTCKIEKMLEGFESAIKYVS